MPSSSPAGSRVTRVRLREATIAADRVVVAARAWAPTLLLLPLENTLRSSRSEARWRVCGLRGRTRATGRSCCRSGHYLLALDDSRVVAGATRESGVRFDYRVTVPGQAEVLTEALHVAPGLATATVIGARVGFRPVGPGIRPLLGPVRADFDGLVIGNGLGAAGLTIGPFAGCLCDAAFGVNMPLDIAPFAPLGNAGPGAPGPAAAPLRTGAIRRRYFFASL